MVEFSRQTFLIDMRAKTTLFLLLLTLIVTSFVYHQGLFGAFICDDFPNIVNNQQLAVTDISPSTLRQAAFSGHSGPLGRTISMASFALNIYLSGMNPFYFKLTNLLIHLLNGIGIFVLTRLLLSIYHQRLQHELSTDQIQWISLAVTASWLLHPLNITSVLYVVQRMASLSAFFTIYGLIVYLIGRRLLIEQRPCGLLIVLAATLIFTPLAAFSKETGVLLPAFMFAIEATVLNWQTPDRQSRRVLITLFALMSLSALMALGYILLNTSIITSGYIGRDFSISERLMTEARTLWFYLRMILIPDISSLGFYHDDIAISRNLFSPPTTMLSIAGLITLVVGGLLLRKEYPLLAFGIFFFLIGHSMESSILGLELIHEHRNYLPMFGILLPTCYHMLSPACHPASLRLRKVILPIIILSFAMVTFLRANHWRHPMEMMQMEVLNHPQSARANSDIAVYYYYSPATSQAEAENNYRKAIYHFSRATALSNTDTAGLFGVIGLNSEYGLPIDPDLIDELAKRLEHVPCAPNSIISLRTLKVCQINRKCAISPEIMEKLISALLRNQTVTSAHRTAVLFIWSDFLLKVKNLPNQAIEAAYLAVAATPQAMDTRLRLIQFLTDAGKYEQAGVEIQKAREMDKFGVYSPTFTKLEHKLAEVRTQAYSGNLTLTPINGISTFTK